MTLADDTGARLYLALGDSMSIDLYTDVVGGGAVAQFHRSLGPGWRLDDRTRDGCVIEAVPKDATGDVITLTIGGNNLFLQQGKWLKQGLSSFGSAHRELITALRRANKKASIIVGNVYAPQFALDPRRQELLAEANQMIARNVAEVGAVLADINRAFRGRENEYLCRLVEPNFKGATAIAGLFRESFEALSA